MRTSLWSSPEGEDEIGAGLYRLYSLEVPSPGRGSDEAAHLEVASPSGEYHVYLDRLVAPLDRMMWRPWRRPRTEDRIRRRGCRKGLTPKYAIRAYAGFER
jgi:hypothetical protein